MTPYPSDEVVAQAIADGILSASNASEDPATRICLKQKWHGEGEHDLGGLNRDALISNILTTICKFERAQQSDKDLREFTKAAMTGILSAGKKDIKSGGYSVAEHAVFYAKAALSALEDSAP